MVSKIKEYKTNDSETVYMVQENSDAAKDYLYQKYKGLIDNELLRVRKIAYALKVDWSDLVQEALLGFAHAINTYDEKEEAQFSTFATTCVRRKLINYINKANTTKNHTLKTALSLNYDDETGEKSYMLKDLDGKEPLNKMMVDETISEVNIKFSKVLNEEEKKVLELSIEGKKSGEIAAILNMPEKKVYNILYRARKKLKNV